jgi:pimeloyl-ACP methyl ester carboxylesterase
LIRSLRADPALPQSIAFVGWPHDTLASIDTNSLELSEYIEHVMGADGQSKLVFVAHSRGGLVARATAVKLCERNQNWRGRVRGCVTFGSPHMGAELAETPSYFQSVFLTALWAWNGHHPLSLSDALWYLESVDPPIRGIADLRPITNGGEFLSLLRESERRQGGAASERWLDVLAIGAQARADGLGPSVVRRLLGGSDNDLVIRLESAAPPRFHETFQTDCDHFSYFGPSETPKQHFLRVVAYLKDKLDWPPAKAAPEATGTSNSSADGLADLSDIHTRLRKAEEIIESVRRGLDETEHKG